MRAPHTHSTRRPGLRPTSTGVLLVAVLLLCAGLSSCTSAAASRTSPVPATTQAAVPQLVWSAPERSTLSPGDALTVRVTGGMLRSLDLVDALGRHWPATSDAASGSATGLPPNAELSATATTVATDGTETRAVRAVRTGAPPRSLRATVTPADGATVGVGQPVIVDFNVPVQDHAGVERSLRVAVDRPVGDAGWYWFNDSEVQYRPKTYWPAGTHVTVSAALDGVRTGGSTWGIKDTTSTFAVGRSQILRIDDTTHMMTVQRDGAAIRTVPVSLGQDHGTWRTRSGIKTIMAIERTVHMDSSTVGIDGSDAYNEDVPYAMRVTWSGEYVHGAPWSEWAQGRQDISHGCTNVSLANGKWLFENSLVGDPVETVGTDRPMEPGNGWGGGWNLSWSAWKAGSALA